MYKLVTRLVIYRDLGKNNLLSAMADIAHCLAKRDYDREELAGQTLAVVNRLLDVATRYGFDGNLWHSYLAYLLATTEAPFTLVCEKRGAGAGSVRSFAENDLSIFRQLWDYDFSPLEEALGINAFSIVTNYQAVAKSEQIYNKSVSDKVRALTAAIGEAADGAAMFKVVTDFYAQYGVGMLGLNKAFRVSPEIAMTGQLLEPITTTGDIRLTDIVGYESQKERLAANTEAFVQGRKANNVLLYGDAGTGKSTSIKAILNEYYDQGLRMIEVYKHEFKYLQRIIARIKNRNYKFIIYMDDLSFEEFEVEYKYLKAVIEGGLEVKPDNILIYATSNRRHLIKERLDDRAEFMDPDLHPNDTVQEKLSLADRFGLSIGYFKPNQKEYYAIVEALAARYPEITLSVEELRAGALRWEMSHSGLSGRTAQQYINSLLSDRE
ncbi:MAG: ATP-binding protein [Selenomonas sp.]|uniref:ATP-binding protein n=1 Tax=Selenomonas sp. TaxID=2053611 RepID=UPI0025D93B2E|nr:ATP-binding protein [Selenomonas sp.]MCR5757012.1 ATP-binding protein [Selenomonas sp.]